MTAPRAPIGELIELPWSDDTNFGGWGNLRRSVGLPQHVQRFDDGTIGTVVVFSERHTSYPKVVHGRMVTALVDQVMGDMLVAERGVLAFSATLRVRMLSPLVVGRTYRVVTGIRSEGYNVIHTEADVTDEDQEVHVIADGTFRPIRSEQAHEIMGLDEISCLRLKDYFDKEMRTS
jgi:acyl-coenzyme A thioesterase PaaI-like protein